MPELPEVETIVRRLDRVLKGKIVSGVKVLRKKSFDGKGGELVGKEIKKIWRKSKMIVVEFEDWNKVVLIHFMMTGQLVYIDFPQEDLKARLRRNDGERVVGGHPTTDWVGKLPSKHTRVVIDFTDGSELFFNDMRAFAWMKIQEITNFKSQISNWPPDVVDKDFDFNYLKKVLGGSRRAIKLVLMDQKKMGGVGNIYANEALYLAKVNPQKQANSLNEKEIKGLRKAIRKAIDKGIRLKGIYQKFVSIYGREGERCKKCGGKIEKFKLGGRGTYWCKGCQR